MDYWDWLSLKDDFYRPDPRAPGSWRELYWWRVILGLHNEWLNGKYDADDADDKIPTRPDDPDSPTPRQHGRRKARKIPQLPSQKRHRG